MFGMGERLKLPLAGSKPRGEAGTGGKLFENLRKESLLGCECFGGQAGHFARRANGRKVDLRREVLFARAREQIGGLVVLKVRPQSPVFPFRRKEFLRLESVIDGHQTAPTQGLRGALPPGRCRRTHLGGEAVRQNVEQLLG